MMFLLQTFLLISPFVSARAPTQYVVHNLCPQPINLYIGGNYDSVLPTGGSVTRFMGPNAGFFYTNANGGAQGGGGMTRAGFALDEYYYYIVKDVNNFNTGMSIAPRNRPMHQNTCETARCDDFSCTTAYSQPPSNFPAATAMAPQPPLYACLFSNTTYDITFCPSGAFPIKPVEIHPRYIEDKCLDVRGGILANGTPVQLYDCNGTPAQKWILKRGSTAVQLAGTSFCLDAGSSPKSGVGLKIWKCYNNTPAQKWFYTDDNRLVVEGKGQCIDLANGDLRNGNQLQTWACATYNTNQVWTLP
ncbi:G-X-X-X-Q-X-W domain-containing protein [Crucibulum laeve]|uniref:G-X-X-X-Q-X-W domain-containing protein n=1 Tax=Crucibulum laeve TaxID=68775 RepID=A0A5C3LX49_9AGAR|nr:G-X-X-X-Q-X-W domain-containing protein [Crucibulum laeve]